MTATVCVLPNYPDLPTLESLFSEGPVSFAKLAAEASRRKNEISHQFCFETFSTDHYVTSDGQRQSTNLTKNKEKDKDREKDRDALLEDNTWKHWGHMWTKEKTKGSPLPVYNPGGKYCVRIFWMVS